MTWTVTNEMECPRYARIGDGIVTHCTALPEGTLKAALEDFALGYERDENYDGDDVNITAELIVNGEEVELIQAAL